MEQQFTTKIDNQAGDVTELVFILDKSGSMEGLESDTIGGFNAMIKKQKSLEGKALVSTLLFSDHTKVLHDRKPLEEIKPLTLKDYEVDGCTALLDAIGDAIKHISNVHKYARKEDVPNKTMFIITTDGMENASTRYSSNKIKDMIKRKEEHGWEFIFLASNIDAVETAKTIGIEEERAVNYDVREQTEEMFEILSDTVCQYRTFGCVPDNYAKKFEKKLKNKRKRK